MKRKKLLLTATAVILSCNLISCGDSSSVPDTSPVIDTTTDVTSAAAEESVYYPDTLPEMTFDGAVFSMIGTEHPARQTFALESESGEPVNDALVKRDRSMEEAYDEPSNKPEATEPKPEDILEV